MQAADEAYFLADALNGNLTNRSEVYAVQPWREETNVD